MDCLNTKIKNNKKKNNDIQMEAMITSIKTNWLYYVTLWVCFYILKRYTAPGGSYAIFIITYAFISLLGHFVHMTSHNVNFNKLLKNNCKHNIFYRNKYCKYALHKWCDFLDFHSTTHHDSSVNKAPINIVYEFINNLFTQGCGLIVLIKLINLLDTRIILLWAFMYASVHNINYVFLKPTTHRDHHKNDKTNYGIDISDIMFNTKYDWNDIENHNHISINLIIISVAIAIIYAYF